MNWTPATLRARNPFPCHTSEKSPRNSNHCHTSKTAVFNPCVCHTSETPRGSTLPTWELTTRLSHLKFFLFILLRTLLHLQKSQLLYFQAIPHSLQKTTRGGGTRCSSAFRRECPRRSNRRTCKPSNASACCIIPRRGRSEIEAYLRGRRNLWGMGES